MMVYLTGGIGTGKSTALSMFADRGARIVSADVIVHTLLVQPELQAVIANMLGIEDASDRATIARAVFADPEALRRLEALVHPLVAEEIDELRRSLPPTAILVYEVPLPPTPKPGEVVIAVEAPLDVRMQRLRARGLSETDASARIAVQADAATYRQFATHVLSNAGDEASLSEAVDKIWEELQRDARSL